MTRISTDKITFCGAITEGGDNQFLIGDSLVSEELEEWGNGKVIHLRYTVSSKPIDPETVDEKVLQTLYGVLDAEHGCIPFSEWTGFVAWDDTLRVGDHDLKNELLTFEGQYCYLELVAQTERALSTLCPNCGRDYFENETIVDGELRCACARREGGL